MTDDTKTTDEPAGEEPKAAAKKPAAKKPAAAKKDAAPKQDAPKAAATPEEKARAAKAERASSGESRPVRAVAKYLRFSAQKGRLVVDQIRGKSVLDAATALAFSDRNAAREVMKVLKSAVSNAENNHGMSAEMLYVSAAFADEGPTFKRFKPRARGRADRINKRTCHITVIVDNMPAEMIEKREAKATSRGKKAAGSRAQRVAGSKKTSEAKAPAKKSSDTKAPAKKAESSKPTDAPAPKDADTPTPEAEEVAPTVAAAETETNDTTSEDKA